MTDDMCTLSTQGEARHNEGVVHECEVAACDVIGLQESHRRMIFDLLCDTVSSAGRKDVVRERLSRTGIDGRSRRRSSARLCAHGPSSMTAARGKGGIARSTWASVAFRSPPDEMAWDLLQQIYYHIQSI